MPGMPQTATGKHRDAPARDGAAPELAEADTRRSSPSSKSRVDAGEPASVSFAAKIGDGPEEGAASNRSVGLGGNGRVGVGPGIPGAMLLGGRAGLLGMNPFPIVGARIHPPLMRADTLSRERLNAWLDEAATGRVALVVAEAGFGKTTLLGDWARNSSRLTAWYRLDPDDRDWLTFCRHLVASGRELDPEFAPETYALLMQLGPGGPTRADIQASLVDEFAAFGAAHPQGLTLIFDDYHAVDGSDEVVPTVRALIERTGPGFSVVIASRSTPRLPLGRLRARGAVSRISGDALCFDVPEADRLFRDAYHMPIEPDVVDELVQRTEGWAALLSLVNVSLGEQLVPDARGLVSQLSATTGDLYDFLAEEVVASLAPELHTFLSSVSVLTSVDVASAQLVVDADASEVALAIGEAETLGLLSQPDRESPHRFHPLVRAFLQSQLAARIGDVEILNIHERVGQALEGDDWATSAWHYRAAGDEELAARVVDGAIDAIFASGQFERARPFLDGSAGAWDRPGALILRSRLELSRGNYQQASAFAERACDVSTGTPLAGQALLNMSSILGFGGFEDKAVHRAEEALRAGLSSSQQSVAKATIAMWEAGREGRLDKIADGLRELAVRQDVAGHHRYAGITRLNLSGVLLWLGDAQEAADAAARAQVDLGGRSLGSAEFAAAAGAEATALAQLGKDERAHALLRAALEIPSRLGRDELYVEIAKLKANFGDASDAATALAMVVPQGSAALANVASLVRGALAIRSGALDEAVAVANSLDTMPCTDVAGLLRGQLLRTRCSVLSSSADSADQIAELHRIASAQRSRPGILACDLLRAIADEDRIHTEVVRLDPDDTHLLSELAEEIAQSLHRASKEALVVIRLEAHRRPSRWAGPLRTAVMGGNAGTREALELLAEVGSDSDAGMVRALAAREKAVRPIAAAMSRRLAPVVEVSDLGIVEVRLGGVPLGKRLRRKVLGLLCFVASRPGMASTRDEALEALWPDLAPSTAVNSLHQTIYFLRRLLEPNYKEGIGAGYVLFDGEVLSFDSDLIDSRSRRCWRLITSWQRGDHDAIDALLATYAGKFALDFSYEDWAAAYRENLHAAVLGAVEQEIAGLIRAGNTDKAALAAQSLLLVDPTADAIELQLLQAYKRGGRHAAAAEQYSHYSSMVRDELGVEPPAFADI